MSPLTGRSVGSSDGLHGDMTVRLIGATCAAAVLFPAVLGGGVHRAAAITSAALCLIAFGIAAVRCALRDKKPSAPVLSGILILAALFTLLQSIPIPETVADIFTGQAWERAGTAASIAGLSTGWRAVSVEPWNTLSGAAWLFLGAGFVCAATWYVRATGRSSTLLKAVAAAGAIQFAHGLFTAADGSMPFDWFLHYRSAGDSAFRTSLVNANHSAALFNLSAFAAVALGMRTEIPTVRRSWFGLATLMVIGTLLTWSRGGAVALAAFMMPLAAWYGARTRLAVMERRTARIAIAGILMAGIAAAFAAESALGQWGGKSFEYDSWESKRTLWRQGLCHLSQNPLTGSGFGSFGSAAAPCADPDFARRADFAENILIQPMADWGIPFGIIVLGLTACVLVRLLKRNRKMPQKVAVWAGICCVVAQNLADFSLYVPGIAVGVLALASVLSARDNDMSRHVRIPWRPWAAAAGLALLAAIAVAACSFRSLESAEKATASEITGLRKGSPVGLPADLTRRIVDHPHSSYLYYAGAITTVLPEKAERFIDAALTTDPWSLNAGLAKAQILASKGNNAESADLLVGLFNRHKASETLVFRTVLLSRLPDRELAESGKNGDFADRFSLYLERAGMTGRDILFLTEVAGIRRDKSDLYERIGELLLKTGHPGRADAMGARVMAARPDEPAGYVVSGMAQEALNNHPEALALYDQALSLAADNIPARFGRLRILNLMDRGNEFDDLARSTAALLRNDRGKKADLLLLMARRARKTGSVGKAIEYINKAMLLSPERASIYVELGDTLMIQNRVGEAITAWKSALDLNPDYKPARERLAGRRDSR